MGGIEHPASTQQVTQQVKAKDDDHAGGNKERIMARKNQDHQTRKIFKPDQRNMFEKSYEEELEERRKQQVECLGMTFINDDARREYFLGLLREKLKDPEFRKIEGFPIGEDEDILTLSDPPYYTACPNPWLEDFVKLYGKPYDPNEPYNRKPFAVDVSVGKTDPIYRAHSYHTKVPHLAIVPSILHYTEPGDVVLDGFCGSGMTGVAAQWCGSAPESYRMELETAWKAEGRDKPKWGTRSAILGDLSPAATFIAANYNLPFNVKAFGKAARRILDEVEEELGWMYETLHVEPASSRLIQSMEFEPCDPFQAPEMTFHRDNLPHIQVPGATYFITFRTEKFRILSPEARSIALNAILHWDRQRWNVVSVVVMPDHVHLIARPVPKDSLNSLQDAGSTGATFTPWPLADILHSVKSFSANEINKVEGKKGVPVWQTERYDRVIRDARELVCELAYLNHNPVKAGLTERVEDYEWRYVAPEIQKAGWKPAPLGRIEYTVWSEVFSCPDCAGEVVFLEEALNKETKRVRNVFPCPHCGSELSKKRMELRLETQLDANNNKTIHSPKRKASLISYKVGNQRYEKEPDQNDLKIIERIRALPFPTQLPAERMMHAPDNQDRWGDKWRFGYSFLHPCPSSVPAEGSPCANLSLEQSKRSL